MPYVGSVDRMAHMEIPGFEIERLIAEGGMASAYLAVQESLGRRVVLKVLREFDNAEQSRRFLHEGRIIASLSHRNIITIHDIGRLDSIHYIAMEYLEGGSLADRIVQGMEVPAILDLLEKISRCLVVVHSRGIVHRDIKPVNILFHADQTPKLTDFGIAKELDSDQGLTVVGGVIGTSYYISPEQAHGKPLDGRSDIYSLGIVFYEMLMGTPPYAEESHVETIVAHLTQHIPLLPPQFSCYQELLQLMIAKEPEGRFATAGELVGYVCGLRASRQAFAAAVSAPPRRGRRQPIDAPPSRNMQARKPVHRRMSALALWHRASRKAKIALGTILAAMAVGGILLRSEPEKLPQPMPSPEIERDVREVAENQGLWSEPASDIGVREALASYGRESLAKDGQTATDPKSSESQRQDEEEAMSEVDDLIEQESQPSAEGEIETASSSDADESMETPLSETTEEPAVQQFLSAAEAALADYRLTTPDDHSASFYYRQVLELVPDHPEARRGLVQIADRYASLARKEIGRGQFQRARRYIRRGLSVQPAHSGLLALKVRSSRSSKPSKPSRPTSSDPGGYFLENF